MYCAHYLSSPRTTWEVGVITSTLHTGKLTLRKGEGLVQGHTAQESRAGFVRRCVSL